ncbi:enoyl-CoA hydratase/isomerase family protein [Clostridium sp.]|uniref:enoyl-CoA hydratase/isomerase family protein n=1 Tax=Clostridium sp. TaxID=1506 RepID=UPI001A4E2BD7|nr:enoyl-CoA hydratase/isomerase family protein [Clostridium sp.]MBK5242168.1 enoyl-CoA hydratase/isomerase family protein [Clostridium sp.]
MDYDNKLILVEKYDNKVAVITLNSPPLNLNSVASVNELSEVLRKIEIDDDINVVIITGAGVKAFDAGSDISEFKEMRGNFIGKSFKIENDMMNSLEYLSKPTIVAMEGFCMGGGLELALCCDIRIMSEATRVSVPEINLGIFPAAGGLHRLPKVVGQAKALEMMYLGESIDANECRELGLANHLAPVGETVKIAMEMAVKIAQKPTTAIKVIKKGIRKMWLKPSDENYYSNLDIIENIFSGFNGTEGVEAFLSKRKPNFK